MSAPPSFMPGPDARPFPSRSQRLPRLGEPLRRGLSVVDRLFDRVYGSALNPLYQTGSLIVAMLLVMLGSGLYLFLFYETGRPYASMQAIVDDPIAGFLRSLHRYSADASIVLVLVHAGRMFLQGKTWGARVLAWVSGIVALGVMLVCGWTGLVLVWDELALEVAAKGARILDLVPVFPEPIASLFVGKGVGPSFFFTNLFLHLALPLALLAALGVHVVRLSRPRLFPPARVFLAVVLALAALAALWPVALGDGADVSRMPGAIHLDWYFAFWLPLVEPLGPAGTAGVLTAVAALALATPLWWRPRKEVAPLPSYVDEPNCRGCSQCYEDCPYGAITMVPRTVGSGSEIVARVDPDLCTSCGICAASCDVLRVGPPGRRGRDLLHAVQRYGAERDLEGALVFIGCTHNPAADALSLEGVRIERFPVECAGSVHLTSVRALLKRGALGVVLQSCAPRDAMFRDGPRWLKARLDEGRRVGLPRDADREHVLLLQHSEGEMDEARDELREFALRVGALGLTSSEVTKRPVKGGARRALRWGARGALSAALLGSLAAPRLVTAGAEPAGGTLRLAWSDAGAVVEVCRALSEDERRSLPAHMQRTEQCTRRFPDHQLRVTVDDRVVVDKVVRAGGARSDRPARVMEELPLTEGEHRVAVEYRPLLSDDRQGEESARALLVEQRLVVRAGRVHEVSYDDEASALRVLP